MKALAWCWLTITDVIMLGVLSAIGIACGAIGWLLRDWFTNKKDAAMTPEALQRIEAALARTDEFAAVIRVVPQLDPQTFPVCVERADLRALLEERRWISVQEELPGLDPYNYLANCHSSTRLLLWHKYDSELVGSLCEKNTGERWWEITGSQPGADEAWLERNLSNVTHWMPLPAPPTTPSPEEAK